VESIQKPRRIVMLVMAGKPVDDTIAILAEHMEAVGCGQEIRGGCWTVSYV
jgi:6-phosphogluconate dehydrogenase